MITKHINLYWVYDLPNWLFGCLTVGVFMLFGVVGLYTSRRWVRRVHMVDHSHNDIVGYYLSAVTVLYGITLGLVAVGTWDTFTSVQQKVDAEAQTIASLWRDVGGYDNPYRDTLRSDLKDYTRNVVDVSWPQQRQGILPSGSGIYLDRFQADLMNFKPKTMSEEINQTEVFKQFNVLVEERRARLASVETGLPASLWALVILGGLINIVLTFFFDTKSFGMHFWMTVLTSGLLGLLIFLVGTLDNPFRGEVSIGPDSLVQIYQQLMAQGASDTTVQPMP